MPGELHGVTADGNFTAVDLLSLDRHLQAVHGDNAEDMTAPSHSSGGRVFLDGKLSRQLWAAIRRDSIAAFAARHPRLVTPKTVH